MSIGRERDAVPAVMGVPVVVLACTACRWVYQPDRAAFESGMTGCPRCGGWTWIAQLGTGEGGGR
jgi:hypothetical protein